MIQSNYEYLRAINPANYHDKYILKRIASFKNQINTLRQFADKKTGSTHNRLMSIIMEYERLLDRLESM